MTGSRLHWVSAAGVGLAAVGGVWGGLDPAQTWASGASYTQMYWVQRLALVAAFFAVLGAILVLAGRVRHGGGLSLAAGLALALAGSAAPGIAAALGATLCLGSGERPDASRLRETLRNATP